MDKFVEGMPTLSKLIEALQILLKYGDPGWPTHCEHDVLTISDIDPSEVSEDDKLKLHELGFFVADLYGDSAFHSYKYGSA